jgi:hypothetical protein
VKINWNTWLQFTVAPDFMGLMKTSQIVLGEETVADLGNGFQGNSLTQEATWCHAVLFNFSCHRRDENGHFWMADETRWCLRA